MSSFGGCNVRDVALDGQHVNGAISAGRTMPGTELMYTIDGLASRNIFFAVQLSPNLGDALAASAACTFSTSGNSHHFLQ